MRTTSRRPASGVPLSNATLRLHSQRIAVPTYERSALQRGVVHIGAGNFHRAHQAVYFDDLARSGISHRWGVTGVSLHSPGAKDLLSAQDGLYTVVQRGHDGQTARVVGSIGSVHFAPHDGAAVRAALADPQTRIVSLTITDNGYFLDPVTDQFDADHPDVRADLVASGGYATAWGYLAEALDRRRRAGFAPFTVLCCDNIPGDTRPARTALISFAACKDPGLARWIERHVAFPSTMVDRITPQTSTSEREFVEQTFGVADKCPVVTEPYRQWVIEDSFSNGRPPLEEVGAEFVADVSDHKLIKTRLLNGTHIALACLATLAGYQRTDEAMRNRVISDYVETLLREEIQPLLPAVPGMNTPQYRATLLDRLSNPSMSDQLSRLARRGTTKITSFVLPSLQEAIAQGRPHTLLTLAVAGWARYMRGHDLQGRRLRLEDSQAIPVAKLANMAGNNPDPLLRHAMFAELRAVPGFARRLGDMIADIDTRGVVPTLRDAMRNDERELVSR
ncbi:MULTISPECIES: mannitol dehydrogenase family protein [unclassified Mycobacterium]|uniref:mannitol dehydrogenase family protein n=1 Tax=unclassified Mycobacterium TaxID=2642494 RepID=UPI0007FF97E5|nr:MULTISPECIES: mannitol dehydrogenase family protein [unclassified Mycobacterium]OBG55237.1 mannitol dehydrogenase [Mycobacterium sp. E188]OBG63711.1 mannitol dehydrogenase [Mycobacterium sp. E735]OBH32979.1 mannitol dehydrogenase [Mycobacterium sp. E183]